MNDKIGKIINSWVRSDLENHVIYGKQNLPLSFHPTQQVTRNEIVNVLWVSDKILPNKIRVFDYLNTLRKYNSAFPGFPNALLGTLNPYKFSRKLYSHYVII